MAPGLAGWRVERMPTLPETAYFPLAPDWICEILSKSTVAVDRNKKLPLYAAHGVSHVWLIDPIAKTLEVHALDDDRRWRDVRVYEGDVRATSVSSRRSRCSPRASHGPDRRGSSSPRTSGTCARQATGGWGEAPALHATT